MGGQRQPSDFFGLHTCHFDAACQQIIATGCTEDACHGGFTIQSDMGLTTTGNPTEIGATGQQYALQPFLGHELGETDTLVVPFLGMHHCSDSLCT